MYEIEKHVDMPSPVKRGRASRYPFSKMEIGDSFFVEGKPPNQLSSVAYNWSKRNNSNIKFVVKREGTGSRIWRFE